MAILTTYAAQVTPTGVTSPSYSDILETLKAQVRQIMGEDVYLEADSMDGQMLGIYAQGLHDCNQTLVAVYNSFSPQTASGAALSNAVKINHMQRAVATNSQVNVQIGGVAGTTITNGKVEDTNGNQWALPNEVTIPPAGTITVTATAVEVGAVTAAAGSVTKKVTPTAGWQTVNNVDAASPGQPIESDAELRARQVISPAVNSTTVLEGIAAALNSIPGVDYGKLYENDTNTTDVNGLPAHSISAVVRGGDATTIAQTLRDRKAPGVATYGTTTVAVPDISGGLVDINFYVPTEKAIKVEVQLYADDGYTTVITNAQKAAIAAYISALGVGDDVVTTRLNVPAMLNGLLPDSMTFRVSTVRAALLAGALGTADIPIAFNEKATCVVANITVTVL